MLTTKQTCNEALLAKFNAQELAIVAWAFATAQLPGDNQWFSRLAQVGGACFYCN